MDLRGSLEEKKSGRSVSRSVCLAVARSLFGRPKSHHRNGSAALLSFDEKVTARVVFFLHGLNCIFRKSQVMLRFFRSNVRTRPLS